MLRSMISVAVITSCIDPPPPAPDATPPPDAAAWDASPPDAPPPDAAAVFIDAVTTADGYTQIRQGSAAEIVIRGGGFDGATQIVVGDLALDPPAVTATEIRVVATVPAAHAPGALDVQVVAPMGAATAPGAITVTHVIVAPTGAAGARGTYQSPYALCDAALPAELLVRSTVELLAGEHTCDHRVELYDVHVVGAGPDATRLRAGLLVYNVGSGGPVRVENLGFDLETLRLFGQLDVRDVAFEGSLHGIVFEPDFSPSPLGSFATIDRLRYRGPGTALFTEERDHVSLSNATIERTAAGGAACVVGQRGRLDIRATTIEGCPVAVEARGGGLDIQAEGTVTIATSDLRDNAVAITLGHVQNVGVTDTTIRDREDTAAPASTAVSINSGAFGMTGGSITGYDVGIRGSGHGDYVPRVTLRGVVIDVAQTGLDVRSSSDQGDSSVYIRGTTLRSGGAGVVIGVDTDGNLGTDRDPGDNAITTAGGFALDVGASDLFWPITYAHGTTLNGHSYDGQRIQGPAEVPGDYRIRDDSTLQF